MMAEKILVIDDRPEMTWLLKRALSDEGYEVEIAHSGQEGLKKSHVFHPDLIVLDLMMPGMDGRDMLSRLREFSNVPVIILTAIDTEDEKVHGLNIGADDYVTKPVSTRELIARIQATLRRAALSSVSESPVLRFDDGQLLIEPSSHKVIVRGEEVRLTPTEYRLLLYLAYNAGHVLTYDQILDNVWGPGYENNLTNVKLYVWYLRRKIEEDPRKPSYILTRRGAGYYLVNM
jgi:DNA-binding response OmpR family regulator